MQAKTIQTPLIRPGTELLPVLLQALSEPLRERDILCITSKIVAIAQGRLVRLDELPGADTRQQFSGLVRREADWLVNEEGPVYLTLKEGIWIPNAGIDLSNAPPGYAILWPQQPWQWAASFRAELCAHYGLQELGVLVTDSQVVPLRRGVIGVALAYAGFEGIQSEIGRPDLYARPLTMTSKAVADALATTAVLLMGEADERTPFVLIRDAPVQYTNRTVHPRDAQIDPRQDLFAAFYSQEMVKGLYRKGDQELEGKEGHNE